MKFYKSISIIIHVLLIINTSYLYAAEQRNISKKILFLRKGEIWLVDQYGNESKYISDSNNIDNCLFSKKLQCLACSKKIDEQTNSLVFFSLNTKIAIKELVAKSKDRKQRFLMIKWLTGDELLYYRVTLNSEYGPMAECCRYYVIDELDNCLKIKGNVDIHKDKSLKVYYRYKEEKEVGYAIYDQYILENIVTGETKVIFSKKRPSGTVNIHNPKISNNKKYIVFLEGYRHLWLYNIEDQSLNKVYEGSLVGQEFLYSSDDRYLICRLYNKGAIIIDLNKLSDTFLISGQNFNWYLKDAILVERDNNIFIYNLNNQKYELLIENASKPLCIGD